MKILIQILDIEWIHRKQYRGKRGSRFGKDRPFPIITWILNGLMYVLIKRCQLTMAALLVVNISPLHVAMDRDYKLFECHCQLSPCLWCWGCDEVTITRHAAAALVSMTKQYNAEPHHLVSCSSSCYGSSGSSTWWRFPNGASFVRCKSVWCWSCRRRSLTG